MQKNETELIMLGTGHAMVTKCYNTCFAIRNAGMYFLVDGGGGNGILSQLEKAAIPCTALHEMFVTHGHTDHILGAVWVIRQIAQLMQAKRYAGTFTVYGHDKVMEMLKMFCQTMFPRDTLDCLGKGISMHELKDGESFTGAGMEMRCFDIGSTKAKQFGFRASLPDGQTLACLGDEPYNELNRLYAAHADWLLCEAFCLFADRDIFFPYEKCHSTAKDAGRLAQQLQVGNLLLYHTEDTQLSVRKAKYTHEARQEFSGNIFVPDDLERICLSRLCASEWRPLCGAQ